MENQSEREIENQHPQQENPYHPDQEMRKPFFQTNTARIIMVCFLALGLLIPLEFAKSLIAERAARKNEVVSEVSQLWGSDVQFYGPILKIPYNSYLISTEVDEYTQKSTTVKQPTLKFIYIFPETLNNKTEVKMNKSLKRGIYNPMVYTTNMKFSGDFVKPDLKKLDITSEAVQWDEATIIINTTNLRSIKSELKIKIGEQLLGLESRDMMDSVYGVLESDKLMIDPKKGFDFNFDLSINGNNSIQFVPIGKSTSVTMDGNWPSPSFMGAFAAQEEGKKISKDGFHADWKILSINRPFAQMHKENLPNLQQFNFGVKLIEPVDEYQQNERVSKYGFLVIGLTFLIFFLIQIMSKVSIHIFQYTMIGLALVMFYSLLISITEHSSFQLAYLISSVAVVIMLMLYSQSILKKRKFSLFIAASLSSLYVFIYIIIQMENYALLAGSIGLFAILGAVMYFSRKIEWGS